MTREAYGRDAIVMMRRQIDETTPATAADGPFIQVPNFSATIGSRQNLNEEAQNPTIRTPAGVTPGFETADGELVVALDLEVIGWHLYGMLGAPVTTDDGAGNFTHTFTLGGDVPPAHTFGVSLAGLDTPLHFSHAGYQYNEMRLTLAKAENLQRVTFGLIGLTEDNIPASLDPDPIVTTPQTAFAFEGTVSVDGVAQAAVVDFSATISNGITPDQGPINGLPSASGVLLGDVTGEGALRARFRDLGFYNAAKAGMLLDVTQTWSKSADRSVAFTYHNVRLAKESGRIEGAGVIEASYPWRFDRPETGVAPLTVVLKNGRPDYDMPA